MHEIFLPFMVMAFTVAVMLGLVTIFRGWMAERDRIVNADTKPDLRLGAPAE